jgi:hypothetical protein
VTRLLRHGRAARLVLAAGYGTAAAGVWVLTGLGWGLIAVGIAGVLTALTAIDAG